MTHTLSLPFGLGAGFAAVEAAVQPGLQSGDERRISQRPTRAPVTPKPLHHRLVLFGLEEPTPAVDFHHQRPAGRHQRVAATLDVPRRTRPRPVPRTPHQTGTHRVPLDVPRRHLITPAASLQGE